MSRQHFVYIASVDGVVQYVGCTSHLTRRMQQHRTLSRWWRDPITIELEPFATAAAALDRESQLLGELNPPHNVRGTTNPNPWPEQGGRIDEILTILVDGPRTTGDIRKVTGYGNTSRLVHSLHSRGAVEIVGTARASNNHIVNVWGLRVEAAA